MRVRAFCLVPGNVRKCALSVKGKSNLSVTVGLIVYLHKCMLVDPRTEMSTWRF